MRHITYAEIDNAAWSLLNKLKKYMREINRGLGRGAELRVYGVPRGGVPAAMALRDAANRSHAFFITLVDKVEEADLTVDDIIDSGTTMARHTSTTQDPTEWPPFTALFWKVGAVTNLKPMAVGDKLSPDEWVVFPWEGDETGSADDIPTRLLQFIGEDPKRGGLQETPARFLKAWKEWTAGYGVDPTSVLKCFEDGAEGYDEMILVKDIPFYSHCEHHLASIFGVAHIGYVPNGKIVGLSKLSRLVDIFARRLQVQERATNQIADALQEHLAPVGIGVVLECRHACMESRGINRAGTTTLTSAMRGALMSKPEARAEFFALIGRNGHHA